MTHDGLGKYLSEVIEKAPGPTDDVIGILKDTKTDVVVSYLPVGSEMATKWYVEQVLEAGCAFVNCIPVFIAREKYWQERFEERGLPVIGDDIKSQVGATIVHRVLTRLMRERGVRLERTSPAQRGRQHRLPQHAGAGASGEQEDLQDQLGHLAARLRHRQQEHPHRPLATTWSGSTTASGPTSAWRAGPSATCPLNIELKLEVVDSPNSAGIVIDAVRCAKLALDRGISGALYDPSSYFMKSPPIQYSDEEARRKTEAFIACEPACE